jgi:hypothetical protein
MHVSRPDYINILGFALDGVSKRLAEDAVGDSRPGCSLWGQTLLAEPVDVFDLAKVPKLLLQCYLLIASHCTF